MSRLLRCQLGFHTKGRALVIPRLRRGARGGKDAPRSPAQAVMERARPMGSGCLEGEGLVSQQTSQYRTINRAKKLSVMLWLP